MIILAADHRGLELKEYIKNYLQKNNFPIVDVGSFALDPLDSYAQYSKLAMKRLVETKDAKAILFCGSGIGPSVVANRNKGVYAAVGINKEQVKLARLHNNINVLTVGADTVSPRKAICLIKTFLEAPFEGGRHLKRIKEIDL